jgi:transcriptional regulator with XRE-family HTH domain
MEDQIWRNLRIIRKEIKKKSLQEIADQLKIDPGYLSKVERGMIQNASFEKIYELAELYEISLEDLVNQDFSNVDYKESEKIVVDEENIAYYELGLYAKKEGITVEEAKTIINLFKKISAASQAANLKDEYYSLAAKAKANGVSEEKFSNMIDYLIRDEEIDSK